MGVLRAVSEADEGGRAATGTSPARTLQRAALVCPGGLPVADDAQRPAALARGATAGPALAARGLFCNDGGRFARVAEIGGAARQRAHGGDLGQPHPAIHAGERRPWRLRRGQETKREQGACGGGHAGTSAGSEGDGGQRTGSRPGGRPGPGGAGRHGPERGVGVCGFKATPESSRQRMRRIAE